MKILEQALNKIKLINKPQQKFFLLLIEGLIGIAGKRTFRNLARYMQIVEHTFSRQMAKYFDFIGLNTAMILELKSSQDIFIAAQDASFISKSGKKTHGIDYFWNGSAGKVEKGLEIDVIAAIKVGNKNEAYALSAEQIPTNQTPKPERKKALKTGDNKIDFCLRHIKKLLKKFFELGIRVLVVDAWFAKERYVTGVIAFGLTVISKLRIDARLLRPYTGPQKKRGRRRKFDKSKINMEDFNQSETIILDKDTELKNCVVHSVSLNRIIKVVLVRKKLGTQKYAEAYLFSTDVTMETIQIYEFYVARFQIEFIFRDAKNFTGLVDCQSRNEKRLHYHFNASLVALNVAKLEDAKMQQIRKIECPFSMSNWSRKYHVKIITNRFISMFGFDPTLIKSNPCYENILEFGSINH